MKPRPSELAAQMFHVVVVLLKKRLEFLLQLLRPLPNLGAELGSKRVGKPHRKRVEPPSLDHFGAGVAVQFVAGLFHFLILARFMFFFHHIRSNRRADSFDYSVQQD